MGDGERARYTRSPEPIAMFTTPAHVHDAIPGVGNCGGRSCWKREAEAET